MSKPSRRPGREEFKAQRAKKKLHAKALRSQQRAQGLIPRTPPALPNACSAYASVAAEGEERVLALTEQMRVLRAQLPTLLKRLAKIPDPRQPRKTRHKLTVVLLYGLLCFVFQFASRREVNRRMTRPQFQANLRELLPELESMPHADTLFRLLRDIDVDHFEAAHVALVQRLIQGKKFRRYLINNAYPIAIDGTQKLARDSLWSPEALQRHVGAPDAQQPQYYVYVLEANLAFQNGLCLPLLSEFLEFTQGDIDNNKQDCEQRAFERLSARLKRLFPRLPILLLLDGLYANGPVMARCRDYHWDFMIVLQDNSLPRVWQELQGLRALQPDNRVQRTWGARHQRFWWVNDIEYTYGPNDRHRLAVHGVVCEEQWQQLDDNAEPVSNTSRHVWLSSRPLNSHNVHQRCNLGARYRWGIEASFLVEKHQGYHYEHCFSYHWNAMKGYHALMRLAHLLNTLARFSRTLARHYHELGVRGFLHFVRETCANPWLGDGEQVRALLNRPFQLRLE